MVGESKWGACVGIIRNGEIKMKDERDINIISPSTVVEENMKFTFLRCWKLEFGGIINSYDDFLTIFARLIISFTQVNSAVASF